MAGVAKAVATKAKMVNEYCMFVVWVVILESMLKMLLRVLVDGDDCLVCCEDEDEVILGGNSCSSYRFRSPLPFPSLPAFLARSSSLDRHDDSDQSSSHPVRQEEWIMPAERSSFFGHGQQGIVYRAVIPAMLLAKSHDDQIYLQNHASLAETPSSLRQGNLASPNQIVPDMRDRHCCMRSSAFPGFKETTRSDQRHRGCLA